MARTGVQDSPDNPYLREHNTMEQEEACWPHLHPKIVEHIKFHADMSWSSTNILKHWREAQFVAHRRAEMQGGRVNLDKLADLFIDVLRQHEINAARKIYQRHGMKVEPYCYERLVNHDPT